MSAPKCISREPTSEMLDTAVAFALNVSINKDYGWSSYMTDLWARMWDVAPSIGLDEITVLRNSLQGWLIENAPGGWIDNLRRDNAALRAERDEYKKLASLHEHMVITCGVAATHPDANLTLTGAYKDKWNSQQAGQVRALRAERDALRELHAAVMAGIDKWCPTDDLEAALDRIDKLGEQDA